MMFERRPDPVMGANWVLSQTDNFQKPVNLDKILREYDIGYLEAELDIRVDGAAHKPERKRQFILVNKAIRYPGRKRFTIAHELGHLYLPSHNPSKFDCLAKDLNAFEVSRLMEAEANAFAAELLMPTRLFEPDVMAGNFDHEHLSELADLYQTSYTATAIRFVKFARYACAIVLVEDGYIRWARTSEFVSTRIRTRCPVHKASQAWRVFHENVMPSGRPVTVPSHAWADGPSNSDWLERVVLFPELGQALVLLEPSEDD